MLLAAGWLPVRNEGTERNGTTIILLIKRKTARTSWCLVGN